MTTPHTSTSPVSLSYVAALRGFLPRRPGDGFVYAQANCHAPETLIALAASNPEGKFYGLVGDADTSARATRLAAIRKVTNVWFLAMKATHLAKGDATLPPLDFLVCDDSQLAMPVSERTAVFDCATTLLKDGGLFNYTYRVMTDGTDALRYMIREITPDASADHAKALLPAFRQLGELFFKKNPALAAKLDQAVARGVPDEFFALFDQGESRSTTNETGEAMRARQMIYAGDADVSYNYVELSIPADVQPLVDGCAENYHYENFKDFAALRQVRSDIWCKPPVEMSQNPAELYGPFAYGIVAPNGIVPGSVDVFGKTIDLSGSPFRKLIAVMAQQPATIGDFLRHDNGKEFAGNPGEIVGALNILIALGYARPMRGALEAHRVDSLAQPRFSGDFNRALNELTVGGEALTMASPVLGEAMNVAPREVLVMQALNRAGLANSVSALLPELERIAKDPASSSRITEVAQPTEETAYKMINDVVMNSIVRWYAYGLLEAA